MWMSGKGRSTRLVGNGLLTIGHFARLVLYPTGDGPWERIGLLVAGPTDDEIQTGEI